MYRFDKLYIDGDWTSPASTDRLEVVDPSTEEVFASTPAGNAIDVDRAVAAARAAFASWSDEPPSERGKRLYQVARAIEARQDEIADVITHEMGMPRAQSAAIQVGSGISAFSTAAEMASSYGFVDTSLGLIVREPAGVVGCITPWNYPLQQIGQKVAYALAAGCTVVLKPSEVAPANAFLLAEIIDEIGFPKGTFNMVTGLGSVAGEALAAHPEVDMVSLTGSTRAGRRVAELASHTIKRLALELGGKSPNVILRDADFLTAVRRGVDAAFANCGQSCDAPTRLIVPRERIAEVEAIAKEAAESYVVGDPFSEATDLGPLSSAVQRERVRAYIGKGVDEGAVLIAGGPEAPDSVKTGYFVRPTIFSRVASGMTIAQEEIFGPVLSILAYETEAEAIEIANDSIYGLSAAVSGGSDKALEVARKIRAGQVRINQAGYSSRAPFGGYRQSGIGREQGRYGLEEFLEVKAILT